MTRSSFCVLMMLKQKILKGVDRKLFLPVFTGIFLIECRKQRLRIHTHTYASGCYDILPALLTISVPITYTINLSLTTGFFADQLKQAKVVPVFMSGDKMNINNYRPISILAPLCKIYEKIICSRLVSNLEVNNLLVKQQHGFRSQHSTKLLFYSF